MFISIATVEWSLCTGKYEVELAAEALEFDDGHIGFLDFLNVGDFVLEGFQVGHQLGEVLLPVQQVVKRHQKQVLVRLSVCPSKDGRAERQQLVTLRVLECQLALSQALALFEERVHTILHEGQGLRVLLNIFSFLFSVDNFSLIVLVNRLSTNGILHVSRI